MNSFFYFGVYAFPEKEMVYRANFLMAMTEFCSYADLLTIRVCAGRRSGSSEACRFVSGGNEK